MATTLTSAADERTSQDASRPNIRPSGRPLRWQRMRKVRPTRASSCPKAGTNGNSFELGREVASEGEARVEALKLGVTYHALQEWRPVADFAGKNPQLKREPVTRSGTG
jgi:hypothetical protein